MKTRAQAQGREGDILVVGSGQATSRMNSAEGREATVRSPGTAGARGWAKARRSWFNSRVLAAVLLGIFTNAYVLRGGDDAVWYANLTFLTLALTGVAILVYRLRGHRFHFRLCAYDWLVALLVVWILAGSLGTSGGLNKALRFAFLVGLPYFFGRIVLVSAAQFRIYAHVVAFSAIFVAILVVTSVVAPWATPFLQGSDMGTGRIQFIRANAVPLSTFFAVGAILVLVLANRGKALLFSVLALGLFVYAIFLTGTRSPVLALCVAGLIYTASVVVRNPSRGAVLLLGASIAALVVASTAVNESLPNWQRFARVLAGGEDVSLQIRSALRNLAGAAFESNPILGAGTGYLPQYPHNIYLEVAAENGLVGLSMTVLLTLLPLRQIWVFVFRSRALRSEQRTVLTLAVLPFVAMLVIKQFSFGLTMHKDLFIMLAVMANAPLLLASANKARRRADTLLPDPATGAASEPGPQTSPQGVPVRHASRAAPLGSR